MPAASAFTERTRESTSVAARIICLTRATERVGSSASSWAATPETCGAAMLVPLMVLVAALLEPTHAARMLEPGACAHARRGRDPSGWGRADGGRAGEHIRVGAGVGAGAARWGGGTCTWTQAPWLEKEDALSRLVVDPTSSLSAVVTGSYVEGEHQSEAELPAEATTITCASQKSGTYATSHSPQLASGRAGRSAWLRRAALRRVGLSSGATLPRRGV